MNTIRAEDYSMHLVVNVLQEEFVKKPSIRGMSHMWLAGYLTHGTREHPLIIHILPTPPPSPTTGPG